MTRPPAYAFSPEYQLHWSSAEKTAARRVFDLALKNELDAVMREAKDRAARAKEPVDLWDLESWLTERREQIDSKYDYRYSVLVLVFATLLQEGRLSEDDLNLLAPDKLNLIRRVASI
jgi:hypothetical protein